MANVRDRPVGHDEARASLQSKRYIERWVSDGAEERRELESLQRLTDRFVDAVDSRAERKEEEVMEV